MGSDERTGYRDYVVFNSKSHKMRKAFAELFIGVYTEEITHQQATAMVKFLNLIYYESPDLFDANQINLLKNLMIKFVGSFSKDEETVKYAIKDYLMLNGPNGAPKAQVQPIKSVL